MDKSSFQKLFKEMYAVNPEKWNTLLTKAGKTVYSTKSKPKKIDRQTMGSAAFDKLMHIDYKTFDSMNKKQNQEVNKPKSIRINNQTLGQLRKNNQRNANADNVEFVDSSAIESFKYDPVKKNLDIKFVGGGKEYRYPKVPKNVADGLYAAPSKGAYVNNVVDRYSNINDPEVRAKMANE